MLDTVWQDLRHAARSLRRTPGFTAAAVITLALGIGANTAIFSLLDGIMLKPLQVSNAEELLLLQIARPGDPSGADLGPGARFSYPQFEQLEQAASDLPLTAMSRVARFFVRLTGEDQWTTVRGQLVSGRYFSTLNIAAVQGRLLSGLDDAESGAHPVAVISYGYWQNRFGASPTVIGRDIDINHTTFTIIGVAARGFAGVWVESPVDVWIPLTMQQAVRYSQNFSASDASQTDQPWRSQDGITWLSLVMRAPGGRVQQVRAALETTFTRMLVERGRRIADEGRRQRLLQLRLIATPFARGFSGLRQRFSTALYVLMAMVVMVLLIACANIANLLLARAASRQREVGIRLSLGASRIRLIRQLLVESLILALMGAAAGVALGQWAGTALGKTVVPTAFALDLRVLGFAVLSSIAAAVLCGLVPAIRATRSGTVNTARAYGTAVSDQSPMSPMRTVMTFQVALSFVLVMAAALLARSLINLSQLDPGFDRERHVVAWINPSVSGFTQEQLPALYARLVQGVESTLGVRSASLSVCGLVSNCRSLSDVTIEGYDPAPGESVQFLENRVTPGYFTTVGIEVLQGRQFDDRDTADARQVAVVNQAAVRRYFGGRSPLGKRFGYQGLDFEIVGVASDARTLNLTEESAPMAYYPLAQPVAFARSIDIRAAGDPNAVSRAVQGVLAAVEPNLIVERVTTMDAQIKDNIAQQQLVAYVTTAFGVLAILLASIGLYGVMSYAVVRRTAEVGVRMAIGARPIDVVRLMLNDGIRIVVAGIVIGVIAALAAGRLIESILFGVSAVDPITYVAVVATLIAVAFTACYMPSRRAALVDPMTALRME